MNSPTKVLLVQWRPDRGRWRESLARELVTDIEWRRVYSENELRIAAAEFAPTVVVCVDDLPTASPRAAVDTLCVLAQQPPQLMVCEVCHDSAPWSGAATDTPLQDFGPAIEDLMRCAKLRAADAPPAVVMPAGRPLLPAILRASLDAVLMLDERGWVTDLNPHAQRLLGIGVNLRPKTQAHVQDLIVALHAAGEGRFTTLPLVALNLEGLLLLNTERGERLGDAALDVIASVVQPQFARCGLLARLAVNQYLAVMPHMSPPADAAVAVGGARRAHTQCDLAMMFGAASLNDAHIKKPAAPARSAIPRLAADLTAAIERHSLAVDFQPQYELANGRGCGAEALVRWPLAGGGSLSPGRFIPIAERNGSIAALDAWVLKTACASALNWRGPGADRLTLAVNVSDCDLNAQYPRMLVEVLRTCRFPAQRLELEIGENPMVLNSAAVNECLRQCKELGVRIAVSHRSGNYSTLDYLARRAVDRLKLDKSLIRRMTDHPDVAASLRAIIALCAELKVDVMAEGVETPAQLHMLRDFGCPRVQGFLLARPMPAVQAQVVMRKQWGNLASRPAQQGLAAAH